MQRSYWSPGPGVLLHLLLFLLYFFLFFLVLFLLLPLLPTPLSPIHIPLYYFKPTRKRGLVFRVLRCASRCVTLDASSMLELSLALFLSLSPLTNPSWHTFISNNHRAKLNFPPPAEITRGETLNVSPILIKRTPAWLPRLPDRRPRKLLVQSYLLRIVHAMHHAACSMCNVYAHTLSSSECLALLSSCLFAFIWSQPAQVGPLEHPCRSSSSRQPDTREDGSMLSACQVVL